MTRNVTAPLVGLLLLLPCCSDDSATPDSAVAPDRGTVDLTVDTGNPDKAAPDKAAPDKAAADLIAPDQFVPPDLGDHDAPAGTVAVEGDAFVFNVAGGRIYGAKITVLEDATKLAYTDKKGHFLLKGFKPNSEVTLRLEAAGYPKNQTGTHNVGTTGLTKVTFQVPSIAMYNLLAGVIQVKPDAKKCQMVTTVTRKGKSLYDPGAHGEQDAVVAATPTPTAEVGPIYFDTNVVPDKKLNKTSDDGGVLWANVTPGDFTLTATKTGVKFKPVKIKCRAGWTVNASPPWGLQVY